MRYAGYYRRAAALHREPHEVRAILQAEMQEFARRAEQRNPHRASRAQEIHQLQCGSQIGLVTEIAMRRNGRDIHRSQLHKGRSHPTYDNKVAHEMVHSHPAVRSITVAALMLLRNATSVCDRI